MKNLDNKFTANLQELSTIEGLTDVEIGTGMKILKQMYADLDGLQSPVFGQYSPGSTIPHLPLLKDVLFKYFICLNIGFVELTSFLNS